VLRSVGLHRRGVLDRRQRDGRLDGLLSDPNCFISAFRRDSPRPGTSSNIETSMLVDRFCR
jgi:hypothetical protein